MGGRSELARGFLAWDRRDLTKKAMVSFEMIERVETGAEISGVETKRELIAIKATLEPEGIEFIDGAGALGVLHIKRCDAREGQVRRQLEGKRRHA
jgi:hypothetical protein